MFAATQVARQIFNNAGGYRTMKRLVANDLDGTLAQSKQSIDLETAALLVRLMKVAAIAVISGGDWPQFTQQLVGKLPGDTDLHRLSLLPASRTKLYRYRGRWEQVYAELFADDERARILGALTSTTTAQGPDDAQSWGRKDRGPREPDYLFGPRPARLVGSEGSVGSGIRQTEATSSAPPPTSRLCGAR